MGIVLGAVLVLIAAGAGYIGTRPDRFRYERTALVAAPSDVVFALINDLHEWSKWSPWEKLDPNMKRTHDGAPAGSGARYAWAGNKKAGEGRMTITESKPNELVGIEIVFIKPFAATNQTTFQLSPAAGGTQVTWSMEGKNLLAGKAMSWTPWWARTSSRGSRT